MPTYAFRCQECGHEFEARTSWSAKQEVTCPQCGAASLQELLGRYQFAAATKNGAASPSKQPAGGFT